MAGGQSPWKCFGVAMAGRTTAQSPAPLRRNLKTDYWGNAWKFVPTGTTTIKTPTGMGSLMAGRTRPAPGRW
jgi:uncharacterized membrane protein